MNKQFFDTVRISKALSVGKLSNVQVQCAEEIIAAGQRLGLPLQAVAYILATAWHEAKLTPVRESLNYTPERLLAVFGTSRISRADANRLGRTASKPADQKAIANLVYGGEWGRKNLGNIPGTNDGWDFRGGGLDQLTGRANYTKVGIEKTPERILEPSVAVASLVQGMTTGRYRGHRLNQYITESGADYVNAREIVNADKNRKEASGKTIGAIVAGYAHAFEAALIAGGYVPKPTRPVAKPSFNAGVKTTAGNFSGILLFVLIILVAVWALTKG